MNVRFCWRCEPFFPPPPLKDNPAPSPAAVALCRSSVPRSVRRVCSFVVVARVLEQLFISVDRRRRHVQPISKKKKEP